MAGGTTYILNKLSQTDLETSNYYLQQLRQAYDDAASDYLTRFSTQAFAALKQYEESVAKIINSPIIEKPLKPTRQHHELKFLLT